MSSLDKKIEVFCQIPKGDGDFDGPEGIVQAIDGILFVSSGDGWIYTISKTREVKRFAKTGGRPLGLAFDRDENLYVCEAESGMICKITATGKVSTFSEGTSKQKMKAPNFAVFDERGWLYISDSGSSTLEKPVPDGAIFRIAPNGETEIFADNLFLPNGLAMRDDEAALYVIQTTEDNILRLAVNPDQSLGEIEVYSKNLETIPDGMAVDANGDFFVIAGGLDRIYQINPKGKVATFAEDPPPSTDYLFAAANCAFGGKDLTDLFISNLGGHISHITNVSQGQALYHQKF